MKQLLIFLIGPLLLSCAHRDIDKPNTVEDVSHLEELDNVQSTDIVQLNTNAKNGKRFKLNLQEEILFEDSLSIRLNYFSHKMPYSGGPTKAMANVSLSKDSIHDDITLSIYGVEGKTPAEDGLSKSQRYSAEVWQNYTIQLIDFKYDKSITIVVTKTD